jgi:very-short-patch-repair endonuclease
MDKKLSPEVLAQLELCSKLIGVKAAEDFNQSTFGEFCDLGIASPIEQLFYTSLQAYINFFDFPIFSPDKVNGVMIANGMEIQPQHILLSYRVDFHIAWYGHRHEIYPKPKKAVVVECDSQQWHERTEKERRYEKHRDRRLAAAGLHTFRFTGKEIIENPFKPVLEVCNFLTGKNDDGFLSYWKDLQDSQQGF